uniref:Uncharacterized protein n=1 Tax=Astyanax mexicanus TaxID=7994 RepID=A0A3B1IPW2_ASTMX
ADRWLPVDSFSTDNGLIVSNSRRWPLIIDPQGQANKWIKNMEKANKLSVIKLSNSNYVRTLENAIQFGTPVLLENVGEELDAVLEPVLLKQTFKQQGVEYMKLGENIIEYSKDFRFYMTTGLRNPHYLPEVAVKVCLLNFMITPLGLQDQLLGIVAAKEKPELEEKKNQLILESAANNKQLKEIEDKILEVLSSSQGNILEDETAIKVLSSSKVLSEEISEKQKVASLTEQEIDETRMGYRPVAEHSSILFFCISDLANIEPMYQYSLTWFINLYLQSIAQSPPSDHLPTRISSVLQHFTVSVYRNVCRSLFEKENKAAVLRCSMHRRHHAGKGQVNDLVWRFLLTGGVALENPHPNPAPEWLSDKAWAEGLFEHVQQSVSQWKEIYDSGRPHEEQFPGRWSSLVGMERMVNMGRTYIEPPTFDLTGSYRDSSCCSPLVFILSSGSDPTAGLLKFADDLGMGGGRTQTISLGQGQGPIAARMIETALRDGTWVVLQNCHLATSWMPTLEKICEETITPENTHPDFSYPSDRFPVRILAERSEDDERSRPKGLRANLRARTLSDPISDPAFCALASQREAWQKLCSELWLPPRPSFQERIFVFEGFFPQFGLFSHVGECNYGGRVTDDKDRRLRISLLSTFYCQELIQQHQYRVCEGGDTYYIPPHGPYVEYIRSLPITAEPGVYGLHSNADITKDNQETNQLLGWSIAHLTQADRGRGQVTSGKQGQVCSRFIG